MKVSGHLSNEGRKGASKRIWEGFRINERGWLKGRQLRRECGWWKADIGQVVVVNRADVI